MAFGTAQGAPDLSQVDKPQRVFPYELFFSFINVHTDRTAYPAVLLLFALSPNFPSRTCVQQPYNIYDCFASGLSGPASLHTIVFFQSPENLEERKPSLTPKVQDGPLQPEYAMPSYCQSVSGYKLNRETD